jgi:hypothetical protein
MTPVITPRADTRVYKAFTCAVQPRLQYWGRLLHGLVHLLPP